MRGSFSHGDRLTIYARLVRRALRWIVASLTFAMLLINQLSSLNAGLVNDNRWLTTASFTDALTGLANRRAFDARFHQGLERCRVRDEPYALLLIDVDEFKRFNDRFGHVRGDGALRAVGAVLATWRTETGEMAARIGGEEFAVALPGVGRAGAFAVGERIRSAIADLAIPQYEGCPTGSVTVSIGAASTEDAPTERDLTLLARADLALYAAKRDGRNRTHFATSNANGTA